MIHARRINQDRSQCRGICFVEQVAREGGVGVFSTHQLSKGSITLWLTLVADDVTTWYRGGGEGGKRGGGEGGEEGGGREREREGEGVEGKEGGRGEGERGEESV
jgi:hypothetical protein